MADSYYPLNLKDRDGSFRRTCVAIVYVRTPCLLSRFSPLITKHKMGDSYCFPMSIERAIELQINKLSINIGECQGKSLDIDDDDDKQMIINFSPTKVEQIAGELEVTRIQNIVVSYKTARLFLRRNKLFIDTGECQRKSLDIDDDDEDDEDDDDDDVAGDGNEMVFVSPPPFEKLPIILMIATAFGILMLFLPYDINGDIIFNGSPFMFHGWVISTMFAFFGSMFGLKLKNKNPKLACFGGYVAILAVILAIAFLLFLSITFCLIY